jgi:hypothetical protein
VTAIVAARFTAAGDLLLEGDPEGFLHLADLLAELPPAGRILECEQGPRSQPYDGFFEQLILKDSERAGFSVQRQGRSLLCVGDPTGRRSVAEIIRRLASDLAAGAEQHVHLEYYPDHPFLWPETEPLVIEKVDWAQSDAGTHPSS